MLKLIPIPLALIFSAIAGIIAGFINDFYWGMFIFPVAIGAGVGLIYDFALKQSGYSKIDKFLIYSGIILSAIIYFIAQSTTDYLQFSKKYEVLVKTSKESVIAAIKSDYATNLTNSQKVIDLTRININEITGLIAEISGSGTTTLEVPNSEEPEIMLNSIKSIRQFTKENNTFRTYDLLPLYSENVTVLAETSGSGGNSLDQVTEHNKLIEGSNKLITQSNETIKTAKDKFESTLNSLQARVESLQKVKLSFESQDYLQAVSLENEFINIANGTGGLAIEQARELLNPLPVSDFLKKATGYSGILGFIVISSKNSELELKGGNKVEGSIIGILIQISNIVGFGIGMYLLLSILKQIICHIHNIALIPARKTYLFITDEKDLSKVKHVQEKWIFDHIFQIPEKSSFFSSPRYVGVKILQCPVCENTKQPESKVIISIEYRGSTKNKKPLGAQTADISVTENEFQEILKTLENPPEKPI